MKKLATLFVLFVALASFKHGDHGYHIGNEAADFKLKNIDGKMVSLADMKDAKGYIVVFTCNHCPFSKKYEDRIIALDKKYKKQGYPVVAINSNDPVVSPEDSYDKMIERAKQKKFSFPYLYDESQTIAKTYGATRTPHVFVLQKNGSVNNVKYIGAIDDNSDDAKAVTAKYVEQAVDALVAGKEVATTTTKAIGCTIKWKAAQ
ncbi:MAG: thioredoxin family protein [Bacteroidetes bacterium]|nr:thioredoxin family protein [Bacteroidota bacterium]